MPSDKEKEEILAQHKAAAAAGYFDDEDDDDEEGEADFDPLNDNDDDDDEESEGDYGDSDDDDDDDEEGGGGGSGNPDHAVLNGTIHLNDEGRVIYSGTWCMRSQLDADAANNNNNDGRKKKKHPKFKLKSQDVFRSSSSSSSREEDTTNGNGNGNGESKTKNNRRMMRSLLFDVRFPTLAESKTEAGASLPTRRTMIFDGFFFDAVPDDEGSAPTPTAENGKHQQHHHSHPQGKKVKERDVEIFFVRPDDNDAEGCEHRISGRGRNEHGPFVIDGSYHAPPKEETTKKSEGDVTATADGKKEKRDKGGPRATAVCSKTYGVGGATKTRKGGGVVEGHHGKRQRCAEDDDDDDSFDDDFDEKTDYGEVNELFNDATMSIEDLRRKYYGGGGSGSGTHEEEEVVGDGGGKVAAKRPRLDDSDDDECGF